ncbi:hypothetical protein CDD82_4175 [Ophiocordyceps australis]|uniref:SGNH hydrolase-type esterase domain-containing protein n=1 Tax=Ophiocordyceps australis TaxID=1399860 RepID=A0A2C5ZPF3_9HYPO|nr:hypothetical protein CDD82_4175 [Ophiocordyceps australis]
MKAIAWCFELLLGLVVAGVVDAGIETKAPQNPLQRRQDVTAGLSRSAGTELRILCAGDSITLGTLSSDGNGYREQLRSRLPAHSVVFAGTETSSRSNMSGGYFAAWPGKTIDYMAHHIGPSLAQKPNLVLLHAGTNDMNADAAVATEGNDASMAASRLGRLIDDILAACPDAVLLVAVIINSCASTAQTDATHHFQQLIPSLVQSRLDAGHHVLAANFTDFPTADLNDCVHPTDRGYRMLGDWWYDFIEQVPQNWFRPPQGPDPERTPYSTPPASVTASLTAITSSSSPTSSSWPASSSSPSHSSSSGVSKLGPQAAVVLGLTALTALIEVCS